MNTYIEKDGALGRRARIDVRLGISALARAVHTTAVEHGWWENERNMGEMIALMHSELSEALEAHRNNDPVLYYQLAEAPGFVGPQRWEGPPNLITAEGEKWGKPEGIASEFADVIIRILDTCEALNIPLTDALINKHNYNLRRPYRHGGKAC
jgi:NTP pyrophosphatase (non-canonical NTP hydrolase)